MACLCTRVFKASVGKAGHDFHLLEEVLIAWASSQHGSLVAVDFLCGMEVGVQCALGSLGSRQGCR